MWDDVWRASHRCESQLHELLFFLTFSRVIIQVPKIAPKFKSLTNAMALGGLAADDARRLFEALCHSLDADVFETRSTLHPGKNLPGRSHTFSHPVPRIGQSMVSPQKAPSH